MTISEGDQPTADAIAQIAQQIVQSGKQDREDRQDDSDPRIVAFTPGK